MTRDEANKALEQRKANPPKHLRNEDLYAGSSMYYYCRICGHISDELPEDHTDAPRRFCAGCQDMKDKGWLPSL